MSVQTDDLELLNKAQLWLESGLQVALATVIHTWGSSPSPPGSQMAMNNKGEFIGRISGGCIEESLVAHFRDGELEGPGPNRIDFGVERQQASRMGLPCGGRLELLVEHLADTAPLKQIQQALRVGERITRRVDIVSGETQLNPAVSIMDFSVTDKELLKTFGPAWQLLIVGDGQLARHLADMAIQLDFRVTICEPRQSFIVSNPLTEVSYNYQMPDDCIADLTDSALARYAIVTLAHDPRQDDLALTAALETQAFYIGALGSNRSAKSRRERLLSLGYTAMQIERIHGPAGIAIGSKRPAEIALSILAQITAIRNGIT